MANDFNSALGLRPGDEPGTLVLDPRPEHQVAPDVIHFAVLATVAEISAATAVGAPVVPATVTVHLSSRARLAPLVGKGRVLRKGKRLVVAEGEVTQHGETGGQGHRAVRHRRLTQPGVAIGQASAQGARPPVRAAPGTTRKYKKA